MQARLLLFSIACLALASPARAQTTLQMDAGDLSSAWSLTSPNAGPNDWVGVAYAPPLEHPFRVVSASMFYIDTFCCQTNAPLCDATCGLFDDWARRVITGADLATDAAGLTPDLSSPLVDQAPVGQNPPAFVPAGSNTTDNSLLPWTLTPDVWTLPANTVFDRPGRLFYAVKYFNNDQWMRFVTDATGTPQHPAHRAIFTNDGFATRSALWGFGNVGMRVQIEPIFFVKPASNAATPPEVLAGEHGVPMLAIRVGAGNAATTVTRLDVDGSGSGDEAAGVDAVRLVLDQDTDGIPDPAEPVLATGAFASDDGRVILSPNRTLAAGAAEEWLVVYDFSASASGGDTFAASLAGPARVASNLGAPYVSGTPGGAGGLAGPSVMVAGTLAVASGPAAPAARIVAAGGTGLPALQVRATASNEAFTITGLRFTAAGSVDDLTEVTGVRLYDDADADGAVDAGEALLASGTFSADDGALDLTFAAQTVASGASRDFLLVVDLSANALGGDGFRAVLGAAADVTAAGVASGPLPSTGPRALTGAPVIGELLTVGGALTAALGAASPPDGTAQPGASDVPMLQVELTARAEAIEVRTLTFAASGSGDEALDVARARLYRDVNANGTVEASDVALGVPQSFGSDDGQISFVLTGELVPANATRRYLLAYDLTGNPTGAQTFSARIVAPSGIAATGQASAAPVTATGSFPLVGRTLTLLGGLSIAVGPESPGAYRVQPGAQGVAVLQLSASAQGESFTVAQLDLSAAGSLVDDTGVTAVRLYRDQGSLGVRDTPDVLLGTATFAADDGRARFVFSPALTLAPGPPQRWLVTYDLASSPSPGQSFRASVAAAADVVATGTLSGPAAVSGLPAVGPTLSIGGGLTASAGPANPAGGRLALSTAGQPMLQVRLQTDLEPITISQVTLRGSGSGDEAVAITGARLFVDTDADGELDPVGDVPLAGPATFAGNDGPVTFSLAAPRTLPAGGAESWLVTYDVGPTASAGDTFVLSLASGADVVSTAPSGPVPQAAGAPVVGAPKTLLGELVAAFSSSHPGARTVRRDAADLPLLALSLDSTAEAFTVTQLVVDAAGSMDDVADVAGLELVLDVDGSGTRSAGDTLLAGPVALSADDGRATFSGLGLPVPAGGAAQLLLTADLTGAAAGGATLRVSVPGDGIRATGHQGRLVTPGGLPRGSATVTAAGALDVSLGAGSPLGAVARRSEAEVPALQLRLVSTTEPVVLTQVVLHGSGTGHEVDGLTEVELWLDANADGQVSAGEPRLARGTFSADDGAVTLPLSQTVQVGPALHLLATYTLSNRPVGGQTFRLTFDPLADLTFTSGSGAVVVDGVFVSGGVVTVGGGFSVAAGPDNPSGGLVNQALQNLAVMQVELEAVNERCTVESFTVRAAGSVHDSTDISGARLVLDADQDGAVSAGDPTLAGPARFADDDAELSFSGIGRTLAPNTSERWLLAYDLAGTASNLESFSARLEAPNQVGVRCQVSGLVAPAGGAVQGGQFTVQEDGALVMRIGDRSPPARFVPEGSVRTPALQLRAASSVQPLTLEALTLTASVSGGAGGPVIGAVDLFSDLDQDGQLDRSDPHLAAATLDPGGRVVFTGLALPVPLDEAQYLLATVDVAPGAAPGARFALGLAANPDAVAASGFGPAQTTGAPFAGDTMTVAGGLNVASGRAPAADTVANDASALVALDLALTAVWEDFTVRRLTVTAEGSMDPATGVRGLALVEDVDGDGQVGMGDRPVQSGLTFPEGARRATFDMAEAAVPAGGTTRLLVVMDLDGVARVDETIQLVLASDLDLVVEGARRGLGAPVGAPVAGDTFTVGASFTLAAGPNPPVDDVVSADARSVPALQLTARAANEDVTLARLDLELSGSLDDPTGISALHLHVDADGDGEVDPEDVELGAPARPTGDDGTVSFAPLSARVPRNAAQHLLVTVDLSGSGQAGEDFTLALESDAAVTAFGARSGAVSARGAPIVGARRALVGALNVRLGPSSPAGQGVWPGRSAPMLQLELFTRGEAVRIDGLTLSLPSGEGVVARVRLVRDVDGDGVASEGEPELASATPSGGRLPLEGLGLDLALDSAARVLAVVELRDDAAVGEMIRLSLAAPEDLAVSGASSGPLTVVGPPVLGSAFSVTSPPQDAGEGAAEGGCSCRADRGGEGRGAEGAWPGLGLVFALWLSRRTRGKRARISRPFSV